MNDTALTGRFVYSLGFTVLLLYYHLFGCFDSIRSGDG